MYSAHPFRQLLRGSGFLLGGVILMGWFYCKQSNGTPSEGAVRIALDWNKFMLEAEVNTEGYRGPVAARAYGYVGLAAYETALPGLEGHFSSLNDRFPFLKLPQAPSKERFNIGIALNECYATIVGKFFLTAPENIRNQKLTLKRKWEKGLSQNVDSTTMLASEEFGRLVADAVYEWSSTDSLGFLANHHNYERGYSPPSGDGLWVTSVDFPMPPLLPYWGKVRPFIIHTDDFLAKPLPPYSTSPDEMYHRQALEIVSLSKPLSAENQWIAEFWNDDRPGLTFSPAGHWLSITNQVIEKEHPTIEKTMETYLKVGFALADAFIACYNSKYFYNLERPETYIQNHIDKSWRPYSPTPPFPSYPSGHAMIGAATSAVLTDLYGSSYKLTDRSHKDLKDFMVKARTFNSFDEMANENAISRVFLGVHWRFDCEEGLRLGSLVGKEISNIQIETPLNK
jgi:hypothetical protein